jgi:pimeloyl-ACP methyl ester carboxylesterase
VVALELPGLGASPISAGRTVPDIAASVDLVAQQLNHIAGCIAFDLAIAVALATELSQQLAGRLLLIDLPKAQWLAHHTPDCANFSLDHDGTYLHKLWNHVRDVDMLESIEPRRPRGQGVYKSPEELDETFLSFAVQPKEYGDLWTTLVNAIHALKADAAPHGSTALDSIRDADTARFALPPLVFAHQSATTTATTATHDIKRGYEDIEDGRIHYRTAGAGDSCVIALLAGPFSSALLNPLLLGLSANHLVVAPDYIGQGDSPRSPGDTTIARTAAQIDELTRKLGWTQYSVYGTHTGAGVALEAAIAFPDRVKSVIIDSCSMQYASERTEHIIRYFPPVVPDIWGSHVFEAWNIQKDGEIFWPWYLPEPAAAKESTSTGLGRLHDSVICMLRSRTAPVWKSMSLYEARNRIAMVKQPGLFVTGPKDIFKSYMPEVKKLAPANFTIRDVPATVWAAKGDPENVKNTCDIFDTFIQDNAGSER